MIIFSQKEHFTGGKGRLPVRKLTADTIDEWKRLVSTVAGLGLGGKWWVEAPTHVDPWRATVKRQVVMWARAEIMSSVVRATGAAQVPESYWQLCSGLLKQEMWKAWSGWEHEDDECWDFWRAKTKWLAGQVFRSGEWVESPEDWDGGEPVGGVGFSEAGAVSAVKSWNAWIENFDLAQHRRVKTGDLRTKVGRAKRDLPVDREAYKIVRTLPIEADQVEYAALTPEAREEMLARRPWLRTLWKSWETLWEGGTILVENRTVVWLEPVKQEERSPMD